MYLCLFKSTLFQHFSLPLYYLGLFRRQLQPLQYILQRQQNSKENENGSESKSLELKGNEKCSHYNCNEEIVMIEELHLIPYLMRMAVIGRHIELYIIRYIFINTVPFNLIEFILKTRYDQYNFKKKESTPINCNKIERELLK